MTKELQDKLISGFSDFKKCQGKYTKDMTDVYSKLSAFRANFINFTDEIFKGLIQIKLGQWQNSGNVSNFMWNKYKPFENKSLLYIYLATEPENGFIFGIGFDDINRQMK